MLDQFRERSNHLDERDHAERIRRRPAVSNNRYHRQQSPRQPNPQRHRRPHPLVNYANAP